MNNSTRFRPRCHKPCNTWRSRRASAGSPAGCAGFARPEGVRPHLPFPRRSDPQGHVDRSALHPLLTQHLEKQSIQLDQGQLLRQGPLPELRCRLQDLVGEEQPRHLRRLALRGRWPPPPRPPVGLEQAGAAPPGGWSAPPGQKRSPASFAASVFLQESLPVSVQQNLPRSWFPSKSSAGYLPSQPVPPFFTHVSCPLREVLPPLHSGLHARHFDR